MAKKLWHPSTVHYVINNKTYSGALKYGEPQLRAIRCCRDLRPTPSK